MRAIGWKLDQGDRNALLKRLRPAWPDVVADHVTLEGGASARAELPGDASGRIVGQANDGRGVQAMVVEIDGSTGRPDGGTYHITWSLDRRAGRKPVESNDVIARCGWSRFDAPIAIRLHPARF